MMQQSTGIGKQGRPTAQEPCAAWRITGTRGPKSLKREGRLTIGALGRRRSKNMSLRSRVGNIDPPKPTQAPTPPAAELPPPAAELPPPVAEHFMVALIPQASSDLQRTHERTQLSRTDLVNRAITLYEFADAEQHAGSELILRRPTGEEHVVKFL